MAGMRRCAGRIGDTIFTGADDAVTEVRDVSVTGEGLAVRDVTCVGVADGRGAGPAYGCPAGWRIETANTAQTAAARASPVPVIVRQCLVRTFRTPAELQEAGANQEQQRQTGEQIEPPVGGNSRQASWCVARQGGCVCAPRRHARMGVRLGAMAMR